MDLLDRLLEHDRWTTNLVIQRCATLTPEQRNQPFGVGPGTIDATLKHMIGNIEVWTDLMRGRLTGPPARTTDLPAASLGTILGTIYNIIYDDFATFARQCRDADRLDATFVDVLDQPPQVKTLGGAIAHVITHNMHHRCELLHMLGQLGMGDLPEGDVLTWEQAQR